MATLPAELWLVIFDYACTDNAVTGASLALVSSYIRALSQKHRLQSIAIRGRAQIARLACALEDMPLLYRPRNMLIAVADAEEGYVAPQDVRRILELVAPTIERLHLHMPQVASIGIPAAPRLSELAIYGPFIDAPQLLPMLRDLYVLLNGHRPAALLRDVWRIAPRIQSLYMSQGAATPHDIMLALGISPRDVHGIQRPLSNVMLMPKSLRLLCIEQEGFNTDIAVAICPRQRQFARKLRALAAVDIRLKLAPPQLHDVEPALHRWSTEKTMQSFNRT